jgi:Flp pilus assembly protein CpaB
MNKKVFIALALLIVLIGVVAFVSKQPSAPPKSGVEQQADEEIEGTEAEQIIPAK